MNKDEKTNRRAMANKFKADYAPRPWAADATEVDGVSWDDVDGLLVAYVVRASTDAGASAQFSRSRDGGALGVRIYDGEGRHETEWGRPGEDLEALLFRIGDYYRQRQGEDALRWT